MAPSLERSAEEAHVPAEELVGFCADLRFHDFAWPCLLFLPTCRWGC